ncbi:hypothetical protein K227x_26040 [Rubripirellula lacrimiformis]|uniref:Uncharacterized protein n=1 Tax=Rubripirellula lacrimiformis TaxID=1930273 RepID=A0A517NAP6_9BACT|nr:hypothetical protein K227x_26040 [Rubripirellula lacrimiformis]
MQASTYVPAFGQIPSEHAIAIRCHGQEPAVLPTQMASKKKFFRFAVRPNSFPNGRTVWGVSIVAGKDLSRYLNMVESVNLCMPRNPQGENREIASVHGAEAVVAKCEDGLRIRQGGNCHGALEKKPPVGAKNAPTQMDNASQFVFWIYSPLPRPRGFKSEERICGHTSNWWGHEKRPLLVPSRRPVTGNADRNVGGEPEERVGS